MVIEDGTPLTPLQEHEQYYIPEDQKIIPGLKKTLGELYSHHIT